MAAAAGGKSTTEAGAARCRRHQRHRHTAGVCPFCLRDRLSRLSAAAARAGAGASPPSSSSSASSICSYSWEESVAQSSDQARPRRERLGMLLRQEGREEAVPEAETEADKKAKRGNFWARLQQLHHGGWHRKDGCSVAHSRAAAAEKSDAAPHKRAPVV